MGLSTSVDVALEREKNSRREEKRLGASERTSSVAHAPQAQNAAGVYSVPALGAWPRDFASRSATAVQYVWEVGPSERAGSSLPV